MRALAPAVLLPVNDPTVLRPISTVQFRLGETLTMSLTKSWLITTTEIKAIGKFFVKSHSQIL